MEVITDNEDSRGGKSEQQYRLRTLAFNRQSDHYHSRQSSFDAGDCGSGLEVIEDGWRNETEVCDGACSIDSAQFLL